MKRFMRGFAIYTYPFPIHAVLQGQFPTCSARGSGVVAQTHVRSIPIIPANVMHPKRRRWTSTLTIAIRSGPFIKHIVNIVMLFTRLFSKYTTRATGVNFHAPFTRPRTIPHAYNTLFTPPTSPKSHCEWLTEQYAA
jgi:hypothetical protein